MYLNGRRLRRRRSHHDRVVHGAVGLQGGHGLRHRRALLADGDVDALHALALLVDDRVDGDGGLARLAVADDQLALAPADRGHGVDGLDPRLEGLLHRLAGHDARRLHLEAAGLGRWRWGPCRRWARRAGSTTRPRRPSPTGTDRMRPVARTSCSSSMWASLPSTTAPTVSSSRLRARPSVPSSNSSSSFTAAHGQPADTGDAVSHLGDAAHLFGGRPRACTR